MSSSTDTGNRTELGYDPALDNYVRQKQIDLAHAIGGRTKVYLDLNFWIAVRDANLGTKPAGLDVELLELLRRGVSEGHLVCPISESVFIELMKQAPTPSRRLGTAEMIDELSLGVSLTTNRVRIGTEIARFFHAASGDSSLFDMQELIWTKLSYTLGYLHPVPSGLSWSDALPGQKACFDFIWEKTLCSMISFVCDDDAPHFTNLEEAASRLDADIKSHSKDLRSYNKVYRDEIAGAVDVTSDLAADAICMIAEGARVVPAERGSQSWEGCRTMARNLLIAAFDKPDTKLALRTLHCEASLHAGLRWNRNTTFETNHFYDFEHASAALAYCDAFFTEGFISHLANAKHVGLAALYGCKTTDNIAGAISILKSMQTKAPRP